MRPAQAGIYLSAGARAGGVEPVVVQHWYLVKLTEEYVRSLAFSKFTMDLCRALRDMEKEHSASCQSAPTDKSIVTAPA